MDNYTSPTQDTVDFLKSRTWFNKNHDKINEILNRFAPKTHIVAFPFAHIEIGNILHKCNLFDAKETNIKFVEMDISKCHDNCEILYKQDNANKIYSGYALSTDGLWRFHSWCYNGKHIIETTEPRLMYYGVEL